MDTAGWWADGRTRGCDVLLLPSSRIKVIYMFLPLPLRKSYHIVQITPHSPPSHKCKKLCCENYKTELLNLINPTTYADALTVFFLPHWLNLPLLLFPLLLLSYWALCGDAPAWLSEPTLDPVIAHRSWRIASLPVGRGHRNGLKRVGERKRGRGHGGWCRYTVRFLRAFSGRGTQLN